MMDSQHKLLFTLALSLFSLLSILTGLKQVELLKCRDETNNNNTKKHEQDF